MSVIEDFNRIEDCDKIDPLCVNAYVDFGFQEDKPEVLCLDTSWGGDCVDLTPAVKATETLTSLYLSPAGSPNCLIYEPERGDNNCINGDDLSRIISMQRLKDVTQESAVLGGDVYMYNSDTELFVPYDLQGFVDLTNSAIEALQARATALETTISDLQSRVSTLETTVADHETRLQTIEAKLTPPADAPEDVSVVFGNINDYSDPNVVVADSGEVTSLDKTHGLYTHLLANNNYGDEIFG